MSLSYTLYVRTELAALELLRSFAVSNELSELDQVVELPCLYVNSGNVDNYTGKWLREKYGFEPNVYLYFTVKNGKTESADEAVVISVLKLLKVIPGQALLDCDFADALLIRDEQLILNEQSDLWTVDNVAKIPCPFTIGSLATGGTG